MSKLLDQDDELRAQLDAEYTDPDAWKKWLVSSRVPNSPLGPPANPEPAPWAAPPPAQLEPTVDVSPQPPDLVDPGPVEQPPEQPQSTVAVKPKLGRDLSLDRVSQALYSSVTRKPLEPEFFEAPRKEELKREEMHQQLLAAALKSRSPAEKDPSKDPKSDASIQYRAAFRNARPDAAAAMGPAFERMTQAQLKDLATVEDRGTNIDFSKTKFDDSSKRGWTALGLQEQAQGQVDRRSAYEQMEALGKNSEQLAAIGGALKQIQKISPDLMNGVYNPKQFPRDIVQSVLSSWTPFGIQTGRRFADPRANEFAMALGQLEEMIERMRTGAVINESEHKRVQATYSSAISAGPEAMAKMFPMIRAELGTRLRAKQAAAASFFPQEFANFHKVSNGATFLNPLFDDGGMMTNLPAQTPRPAFDIVQTAAPEAAQPPVDVQTQVTEPSPEQLQGMATSSKPTAVRVPPKKVPVSNGKETLWVLPEDVTSAEADGYKRVK